MPRAVVGTFLVGQLRVGENSVVLGKARLLLRTRPFSLVVITEADVVVYPTRPKLHLAARTFTLGIEQSLTLGKARLKLTGKPYEIHVSVGPTFEKARLRLRGKAFTLGLTQSLAFGKPKLRLRARKIDRVGQPGLIPTVPTTIVLTPSPAQPAAVLTPSAAQAGLLVPTSERNV